ncbi:hypothetical protein T552_04158 [Pneumocystis carinii B80]|uniref:Uncharacterized protein n=1 Tax=Pneumocystis carinii (strain B80) TaxID=1408658 RepID=A0A0W4ZG45_PNEC8|nr:hypothetical protein T552_04158 [Pneumocystis carinii B80]KTW27351.1 hypothetical protein T552_04158 [Pneumocystis carinii B80]
MSVTIKRMKRSIFRVSERDGKGGYEMGVRFALGLGLRWIRVVLMVGLVLSLGLGSAVDMFKNGVVFGIRLDGVGRVVWLRELGHVQDWVSYALGLVMH